MVAAIEYVNGTKEWCLNHEGLTEAEFNHRMGIK
jgi:hypothetical protein